MKAFSGAFASILLVLGGAESAFGGADVRSRADIDNLCERAPTSFDSSTRPFVVEHVGETSPETDMYYGPVESGSPLAFVVSGLAQSENPFIDDGDFTILVQVTARDGLSEGAEAFGAAEFELDLCTDVVGIDCPLLVGETFRGIATWNAVKLPEDVRIGKEFLEVVAVQPQGPACGQTQRFSVMVSEHPLDTTGDFLGDHLSSLQQDEGEDGRATTWTKGYSPRFENFSWEDARRIAGGTVMRGQIGFEELPRRRHTKASPIFAGAAVGRRRLTPLAAPSGGGSSSNIPKHFDGREAFPECASVIGRVRDQSDCGSCWAFASTEAFNDRRCIAAIRKGEGVGADQLSILSAEDTTACCNGFHCGLSMGCNGGQPGSAWKWFTRSGVVTGGDYDDIGTGETCKPYEFMPCAHHVDPGASGYPACSSSEYPTPECRKECSDTAFNGGTYKQDKKLATEAYSLAGVESIQRDMMKFGSVTAAFSVYSDFLTYTGGVYSNKSGSFMGGHAVKIIGWGTDADTGEDYWLVANSWNPSWGEDGFFRILRGVNECGIEGQIVAGEV